MTGITFHKTYYVFATDLAEYSVKIEGNVWIPQQFCLIPDGVFVKNVDIFPSQVAEFTSRKMWSIFPQSAAEVTTGDQLSVA